MTTVLLEVKNAKGVREVIIRWWNVTHSRLPKENDLQKSKQNLDRKAQIVADSANLLSCDNFQNENQVRQASSGVNGACFRAEAGTDNNRSTPRINASVHPSMSST